MHSQEEHLLVIRRPYNSIDRKTNIFVLSWNVNDPTKNVSSTLLNPREYYFGPKHTEIMSPCNGIYFLRGHPNIMINPSMRQFTVLSQSHLNAPCETFPLSIYGFGFDPKTNDYKVVVMKHKIRYWTADQLYSLNSNSWRKLDAGLPHLNASWCYYSQVYTFVHNCFHWYDNKIEDAVLVLAFDMVNESFRKIIGPKIDRSTKYIFGSTLVPFTESATIGVIFHHYKAFDVWVMKDYWDEGSWTKQYTVGRPEVMTNTLLLGFYGSNKFVWNDFVDNRLGLYDPDSKVETRDLKVYGGSNSITIARYMESIVSLQREKEF